MHIILTFQQYVSKWRSLHYPYLYVSWISHREEVVEDGAWQLGETTAKWQTTVWAMIMVTKEATFKETLKHFPAMVADRKPGIWSQNMIIS